MHRWSVAWWLVLLMAAPWTARAQEKPSIVPPRGIASVVPQLRRKISLHLEGTSVDAALRAVATKAALPITYNDAILPVARKVWLSAENIRTDEALEEILRDSGLHLLALSTGQVVVVRNGATPSGRRGVVAVTTVSGRVLVKETGAPIAGANLSLTQLYTSLRTVSDDSGRYVFVDVASGSYMLAARFIAYRPITRQLVVDSAPVRMDLVLEPLATRLDELITTATGRHRRREIANDVTRINADSVMRTAPIRSVTDLLEGRVPGLAVQRTSGAPGDPARLRLRGASSPLRSNDPIVVVDGIRTYAEQSAARGGNLARRPGSLNVADTGYSASTPSPLDYIDPNIIETIEVFKGPSATTQYGPDAANGVIVITTKKGRAGPTRWRASVEQGRTHIAGKYPELVYRWGRDIYGGTPVNCPASNMVGAVPCTGDSILTFQLLNDPALTVLDRGHRTSASLAVTGGTSALTYGVVGSYTAETGVIKLPSYEVDRYRTLFHIAPPDWMRRPQHLKRWGVTSTVSARLGEHADVSLRTGLSRTEQQKSALQDQLDDLMSTYLDRSSGIYYRGGTTTVASPIGGYYERATAAATAFTNGINLNYRPRTWLTVTADAGLDAVERTDQLYFPRGPNSLAPPSAPDTVGRVSDGQGRSVVSTVNLRANAVRLIGRGFRLGFAAGVNYTGISTNDIGVGSKDLPPGSSLQGTKLDFLHRGESSDATFGWYLEPSVGNTKFNFTTGLRLDGGSSYGSAVSGFRVPTFPKLGFSYVVSEEPWFPLGGLVQSLQVRVAYGRAGRQPAPEYRFRLYSTPTQVFAADDIRTGIFLETLGNTEVRPERTSEIEGGFDASLLDSRFMIGVNGYRKTTHDALLPVPVAPSVYGSDVSMIRNIGVTRNTGLDATLGVQLVRSGPVTWTTQVAVSHRRDIVVSLGRGVEPFYTSVTVSGSDCGICGGTRVVEGYPLDGRWSLPIVGYTDMNADKVLQSHEVQLGDTAVYVGSTVPTYQVTFNTTVSLWNGAVTVDAGFLHDNGFSQRNEVAKWLAIFSRGRQDPATSTHEQAKVMELASTDYNWIQAVNTTRFNTFAVSYRVPAGAARWLGAQQIDVAVQGSNLGLWTNYRGLDPNVNAFGTGNNVTDTGILPQPRTWQFRVDATY